MNRADCLDSARKCVLPNRRVSETADVGKFSVTVSFVDDKPVEVFITKRAKSGSELEELLYELGVTVSKMMQRE
jgi:hypothetical protein